MGRTLQQYLDEQKAWESIPEEELDIAIGADARAFCSVYEMAGIIDPQRARYRPRDGQTFCNIYVSDITRALQCEIPHVIDGKEMTADATGKLLQAGKIKGWIPCSAVEAGMRLGIGAQRVVAFSPGTPGHIAMLVQGPHNTPSVIQAGARCGIMPLKEGFGKQFPHIKYAYYSRDQSP